MKTSLKDKFINISMLWLNGNKRFTELLADKQLDNVIYVYGKYDELESLVPTYVGGSTVTNTKYKDYKL